MAKQEADTRATIKEYALVAMLFALFTFLAFWPAFTNITGVIPSLEGDSYYFIWAMWWTNYAYFNLHTTPYLTNMLYYPIGHSLVTSPMLLLANLATYPLQLLSLPLAYNFLVLLGFMLSGVFTYALIKYLVGDRYVAFVGGMIFAFSSVHVAHTFAGHLNWASVEFLPLFVLFFLLTLTRRKYKYSFFAALSLILITFFGDIEQLALALMFGIVFLYFAGFMEGFRKFFTKKIIALLLSGMLFFVLLGLPVFSQIYYQLGHSSALNSYYRFVPVENQIAWSDSILGFIVPSYYNQLFNPIVAGSAPNFLAPLYSVSRNNMSLAEPSRMVLQDERTSYIGVVVLFLFICGVYYEVKRKRYTRMLLWLSIFLFFFLMSLGPFVRILTQVGNVPGPYLIYAYLPLLNVIKEAGRFFFGALIPIAFFAAVGLFELYKEFHLEKNKKIAITAIVSLLIFFDCAGVAFPGHTQILFQNATVPTTYKAISGYQSNVSVLLLPSISSYAPNGGDFYLEEELYYQTTFKKPLFNGYGKENVTQYEHLYLMPLSIAAYAAATNTTPSYHIPVNENQTTLSEALLAGYNVSYVGVLKQAFSKRGATQLVSYLQSFLGAPLRNDSTTALFSTSSALANFSKLAYYPTGSWIQGAFLCGYYPTVNCTQAFSDSWWGSPQRNMTIFSPAAQKANVSFSVSTLNQTGTLSLILPQSGMPQAVATLTMTPALKSVRVQVQLARGMNQLEFSGPQTTVYNYYLSYVISNFSIGR